MAESFVIETLSPEETRAAGRKIGEGAAPGEVLALEGDLGAGKTVFAQGVAEGLEVEEIVCSPTFTIMQAYEGGRMPFYHFDAYRLGDASEMEEIGCEEYFYGDGLCLVEWAGRVAELLPEDRTEVAIERDPARGPDYRRITMRRLC